MWCDLGVANVSRFHSNMVSTHLAVSLGSPRNKHGIDGSSTQDWETSADDPPIAVPKPLSHKHLMVLSPNFQAWSIEQTYAKSEEHPFAIAKCLIQHMTCGPIYPSLVPSPQPSWALLFVQDERLTNFNTQTFDILNDLNGEHVHVILQDMGRNRPWGRFEWRCCCKMPWFREGPAEIGLVADLISQSVYLHHPGLAKLCDSWVLWVDPQIGLSLHFDWAALMPPYQF